MGLKKPSAGRGKSPSAQVCPDPGLVKTYPSLVEYLVTVRWDDGSLRERSTITLFVEDSMIKLALNDRALERSLYVSGGTLHEALGSLEAALVEDSGDWRAWKRKK